MEDQIPERQHRPSEQQPSISPGIPEHRLGIPLRIGVISPLLHEFASINARLDIGTMEVLVLKQVLEIMWQVQVL